MVSFLAAQAQIVENRGGGAMSQLEHEGWRGSYPATSEVFSNAAGREPHRAEECGLHIARSGARGWQIYRAKLRRGGCHALACAKKD